MAASSASGFVDIFSAIRPPQPCDEYSSLYTDYIGAIRHVADLFVSSGLLSYDNGDRVGLDDSVAGDSVVRENQRKFGQKRALVNGSAGGSGFGCARARDTGVDDNGVVADGASQADSGGAVVTGVVCEDTVAVSATVVDSVRKGTVRKRKKKRRSSVIRNATGGGVAFDHSGGDLSGSDSGPGTRGVYTRKVQEHCGCCTRFCSRVDRHDICRSVVGRKWEGTSRSSSVKSADYSGGLERRAFSPHLISWRAPDVEVGAMISDGEREARSSFWRRKHIENCLAIKRGEAALGFGGSDVVRGSREEQYASRRARDARQADLDRVE